MKLAHYVRDGSTRVGVVHERRLFDFQDVAKRLQLSGLGEMTTIDAILANGRLTSLLPLENSTGDMQGLPVESVKLRSPILNPEKILLIAINYHSHGKEQKETPPTEPYLFTKFRNSLIGPEDPILVPRVSQKADWEVELAVIIGKTRQEHSQEGCDELCCRLRRFKRYQLQGLAILHPSTRRKYDAWIELGKGKRT